MKVAARFKIEDSRYMADKAFYFNRPESMVIWNIKKMKELKAKELFSEKELQDNHKAQEKNFNDFLANLKKIPYFDAQDGAVLTMYALDMGQTEFLKPLMAHLKDKVSDMRFELPSVDLSEKDKSANKLKQIPNQRTQDNTLLQVLAYYGKLDLLPELGISNETVAAMQKVMPKIYEPAPKLSKKYKLQNGKCIVGMFDLSCPEGAVFYDINQGKTDYFKNDFSQLKDLALSDYEALTLYALNKGQEAILAHLVQELGDKVADMKFVLPMQNHSIPDEKTVKVKSSMGNLSTNNSFLQALSAYGKLDLLPKLGISAAAIEKMQARKPKLDMGTPNKNMILGRGGRSN